MAKKPTGLENLFRKTEPDTGDQVDLKRLDVGRIQATGVGLRAGELDALTEIGEALGEELGTEPVARNAIMREAIRAFLEAYLSGDLTVADLAERFERPAKPKARRKG